jgi:hypothetical protein
MENQDQACILCENGVVLGNFCREYMMEVTDLLSFCPFYY